VQPIAARQLGTITAAQGREILPLEIGGTTVALRRGAVVTAGATGGTSIMSGATMPLRFTTAASPAMQHATAVTRKPSHSRVDLWLVVAATLASYFIASALQLQESVMHRLSRF
jgi:hypothetical protein